MHPSPCSHRVGYYIKLYFCENHERSNFVKHEWIKESQIDGNIVRIVCCRHLHVLVPERWSFQYSRQSSNRFHYGEVIVPFRETCAYGRRRRYLHSDWRKVKPVALGRFVCGRGDGRHAKIDHAFGFRERVCSAGRRQRPNNMRRHARKTATGNRKRSSGWTSCRLLASSRVFQR